MKTKFFLTLAAIFVSAVLFAQTNPLQKYLPANASMVMSFNPVKLANKVPGDVFRQSNIYLAMTKGDDDEIRAFLSDPSISGIDFSADLLLTILKNDDAGNGAVAVMGNLKNEALFSLLVKKLRKDGEDSITQYGSNRLLIAEESWSAVAWNDEIFVITSGKPDKMSKEMRDMFSDTTDTRSYEEMFREMREKVKKFQQELCFELLTPKPNNPLTTNVHYKQVMAQPGDIKIWSNGSGFGEQLKKIPAPFAGLFAKLQSMTGTDKTTVINFENGKISGITRNHIKEEMAAIYRKYPATPLNTDLARRLPQDATVLAMMATSMNPDMAKEMMKQSGLNEIMDSLKTIIPFDLNLIPAAFKNEALFAVLHRPGTQKQIEEDEIGGMKSQMVNFMRGIDLAIVIPIANKAKFEELNNAISNVVDSLKKGEAGEGKMKDFNPTVLYNNQLCVVSLKPETATAVLNSNGTGMVPAWLNDFSNNSMVVSLNMKELFKMLLNGKRRGDDGAVDSQEKMMFGFFDQLIVTGGAYDNGSLKSTMEFRFGNANENSFKQLFDLANMMLSRNISREKEYDSKEMAPPSSEEMKVTIEEIKQEEAKDPPPPPPPPPPAKPVKKKKGS